MRSGASVVIVDRRADVLEEAAAEVGERCCWMAAAIRERAGAEQIIGTTLERLGRLDLVRTNAGRHHGMPAMAHTGAARAAVEALTRELASRTVHAASRSSRVSGTSRSTAG